jgi:hypothetical protein
MVGVTGRVRPLCAIDSPKLEARKLSPRAPHKFGIAETREPRFGERRNRVGHFLSLDQAVVSRLRATTFGQAKRQFVANPYLPLS